jgi:N-acetyl-anhydromuramyl-L-alanine amidase AmpD
MLKIDALGRVIHPRVKLSIIPNIEIRPMSAIKGIIIHQTNSPTVESTLNSYNGEKKLGAHFLIDKDGTIYQTASVYKTTNHVGSKLKIRCLAEHTCKPIELHKLRTMKWPELSRYGEIDEKKKRYPERYPTNADSIGIELVGEALPRKEPNPAKRTFETVTGEQNMSLQWLVFELTAALGLPMNEIFRHPTVSYKNLTEASTAKW